MQDIALKREFDQKLYDSMFETVSAAYSLENKNLSMETSRRNLLTRGPWRLQLEQFVASGMFKTLAPRLARLHLRKLFL